MEKIEVCAAAVTTEARTIAKAQEAPWQAEFRQRRAFPFMDTSM
jgi:hypothetical protein